MLIEATFAEPNWKFANGQTIFPPRDEGGPGVWRLTVITVLIRVPFLAFQLHRFRLRTRFDHRSCMWHAGASASTII